METMTIRLWMILHIISRSALLMINGQNTTFYVNVALGKTAWQSSTYVGEARWGDTDMFHYDASLAVDGKVETNFRNNSCSNTAAAQSSAFWEVDLANLYYITTIKIYQRTDVETDRNVGSTLSGKLQNDSYEVLTTLNRSNVFTFNTESSNMFKGIRIDHNGMQNIYICLCEVQVFAAITCNMPQLNRTMGSFTCSRPVGSACAYHSILTIHCNTGYRLSGFNSSQCIDTDRWSRTIGVCEVKRCDKPPSHIAHGVLIFKGGLGGNGTYNTTVSLNCTEGYKLDNFSQLRCAEDEQYHGTLGRCLVKRCDKPPLQIAHGVLIFKGGLGGNGTYNTTVSLSCIEGYKRNDRFSQLRCAAEEKWQGTLGHCLVKRCDKPPSQIAHGVLIFKSGLGGNGTYNTTVSVNCTEGYKLDNISQLRCADDEQYQGILGLCLVVRCYDKMFQCSNGFLEYDLGIEGNLTYNSTVSIKCGVGYNLIGTDHVRCSAHSHWDGTLGYCFALHEMNADQEQSKTSLLGWIITGPLCLILLVTNIVTCVRLRRYESFKGKKRSNIPDDVTTAHTGNVSDHRPKANMKEVISAYEIVEDSGMETRRNKSNGLDNNAFDPYDNLQMENRSKSEYDKLTFERESSLKSTMKNEI